MRTILYILMLFTAQICLADDDSRERYYRERLNMEYEQQRQIDEVNQNLAKQNKLIEEQNDLERLRQSQESTRELQIQNDRDHQKLIDAVIGSTITPPFVSKH